MQRARARPSRSASAVRGSAGAGPCRGAAKAEAVTALAEREGLDLARCTAYSDSVNDVPMLSAVGNAVAINPDTGLRAVAKENGWEVRDFRTGRKAAKVGVPATAGTGAVVGAVMAGMAYRRRRARQRSLAGRLAALGRR